MSTHSLLDPCNRPLGGGYEEAIRQGKLLVHQLWSGREMLTTEEAAKLLGVTKQTIYRRKNARKLLGLAADTTAYRYPSWQFDSDVMPYVPDVIKKLKPYSAWGVYLFFTQKEPLLGGESPLQAIKRKKCDEVIRVAEILGKENE